MSACRFFLKFRFGDRKEILRDRLEDFERPFSIDVISGRYILRDRWRNLRDRFGPSKHLKKNTVRVHRTHVHPPPHNHRAMNWNFSVVAGQGCHVRISMPNFQIFKAVWYENRKCDLARTSGLGMSSACFNAVDGKKTIFGILKNPSPLSLNF